MQNHEANTIDVTKNAVQVWVQDYTQMSVHTDVWANIRKYVPAAYAAPNTVLNGIPSWLLWQIGSTLFPKDAAGTMTYFSLNVSFVNLDRLYAWMKYVPAIVTPTCPDGQHWDATLNTCVADTPVDHTCPTGQHWDTSLQKCVDDTPPNPVPTSLADLYQREASVADTMASAYALVAKIWRGQ
jgi:hypothetical protein